ncbi:hypothetical protein AA0112_g10905 [Alternaria arborescens]|nr:hypothetical protein AA0112_g10905 [Alternaria arborescens]
MSFWSSARNPVAAATVLLDIGQALSELDGGGELVKEHSIFLEKLKNTLKAVDEAMKEGLIPQDLQDDIAAIWKPLLETEVEMVSFMGLDEHLVKTENMKSVTSKFYMKLIYHQRFSSKITRLQNEVIIPLSGLHRSVTIKFSQDLSGSWKTFKRWATESKRCIDKRLVNETKIWLWSLSSAEEKYQAYVDNISSSNCEWFYSKQEYIDWHNHLSKKSSPILWISGIPRVGRTQIAVNVVQKLRKDRRTVAYVFYGRKKHTETVGARQLIGNTETVDARQLIGTLCWNLLNQFPEDVELLSKVCNKDGEPTETEIQTFLKRMCQRRDAIILLDGLDECSLDENERGKLCQFLASSNDVCDVIIFSKELEDVKRSLSEHDSIPRISNCEVDFWNEIERISTRCAARFGSPEEKEQRGIDAEVRSCEVIKEHEKRFPGSREDQFEVYAMLRHRICKSRLPAHIARQIIDEAEYWIKSTFERGEPLVVNGEKTKRNVPYLLSNPIDGARHFPVRNVIATCRRDQVWSAYPDQYGSYQRSSTYFDFVVRTPDGSIRALDIEQDVGWDDIEQYVGRPWWSIPIRKMPYNERTSWMCLIKPGSRLGVVPKIIRMNNFIDIVRVEIFSTFLLEEEDGQHRALRRFRQKREEILEQIWDTRKLTRLPTDNPDDIEWELPYARYALPIARYKKKLQLSDWGRDNVQSLEKQNKPPLPSTDKSLRYTKSTLRSPRSRLIVSLGATDQFLPTPIPTVPKHSSKQIILKHSIQQIPSDYTNNSDKNAHSSASTTFVRMIRELVRPKVRSGYKRLEWTCTCGEPLYSDFEEKTHSSLDQLAARLKQQSGQSSQHGATASIPQPKKAHTRQANTVGYNMPGGSSSTSHSQNNIASNVTPPSGLKTVKTSPPTALQLCIETGKYKLEMSELTRPSPAVSDGELFAMIREQYETTRRSIFPTWARFKKPNKAIFVKFFLGPRRAVSLNYETPSIPPATEVRHNYDYDPCPMEMPPMDSQVFFHHFYASKSKHPDVFWSERLPWKVGPALKPKDNGWGIHLEESPNWALFAMLMCLLLSLSGIIAGIYGWKMEDAQTGVAIGAWLTSVQVMGITAVFFWWS